MKKRSLIVVLAFIALIMSACDSGKKAQEAYDAIGDMSLRDESILSGEEKAQLASMKEAREKGLADKDVKALNGIREEWEAFSAPIEDYIAQYDSIRATFMSSDDKELLTSEELSQVNQHEDRILAAYESRDEEALTKAGQEWADYSQPLRDVFNTYRCIDQSPFTDRDEVFFSDSVWNEINYLKSGTEEALTKRNATALHALKNEWDGFVSDIKSSIEEKKQEIMDQWSQTLDQSSSFANIFTMGTMTTSTSIEGHQIRFVTQYLTDNGISDESIKASLDTYLSMTSSVFQSGLDYLKTYIDDVSIRVEYRNVKGDIVSYREFK